MTTMTLTMNDNYGDRKWANIKVLKGNKYGTVEFHIQANNHSVIKVKYRHFQSIKLRVIFSSRPSPQQS